MSKPLSRPLVDLVVQSIGKSLSKTHPGLGEVHEAIESFAHELPSPSERIRRPDWLSTGSCRRGSHPSTYIRLVGERWLSGCRAGPGWIMTVYLNSRWPRGSLRNRRCVWHIGLFIYTQFHVSAENLIQNYTNNVSRRNGSVNAITRFYYCGCYVFRSNSYQQLKARKTLSGWKDSLTMEIYALMTTMARRRRRSS